MTSIVAIVQEGRTYVAGDSLLVTVPSTYHSGVSQTRTREPKVFKKKDMLFGASGDWRMIQLLHYVLDIPEYAPGQDKMEYLVTGFVKALQDRLLQEDEGFQKDDLGGNILLAWGRELFAIGKNFQICNTVDPYDAIGKSSEVAIGSLHTTDQLSIPPLQRLELALKAAEHHTCIVGSPYWYITNAMEQAELLPSHS